MPKPFPDDITDIAENMGVALYQRFTRNEASLFLRCSDKDLQLLLEGNRLEYLQVTKDQIEFFGYQLLQYLLATVQGCCSPKISDSGSEKIIRSKEVQNLTGLSRTTLWRMERRGEFPDRVPLSAGSVGWRISEVEDWIRTR